ncbi:hypothetical protein H0H81_008609 [Sphagnurus paluster]|uniref:HMG box domain-containing protein n=1 Tax=Sphagnurus paluster TaxID=117069 RepID=A0A9P7KLC0_9AGAR|nr:hypothetical protein H0H81_008609 [Sphagnurus paluster]
MSPTGFNNNQNPRAHGPGFHQGMLHSSVQNGGHDERGSVSDSEDGNYTSYHDAEKAELDNEDDHSALTSQTLNTDGTPKRPMNAFMIFARRRRPQVSAQNQSMRTGEISKILSKEWINMPAAEKQFYQEQARQLKDAFNAKYPDYIYRRRPNNSRRKRKADTTGLRPSEIPSTLDARDDTGFEDAGDSPTDAEDPQIPDSMSDVRRSRHGHDVQSYGEHASYRTASSRASPYAYPSNEHAARSHSREGRLPYESSGGARIHQENATVQQQPPSQPYSYLSIQGQARPSTQPIPVFGQQPQTTNNGSEPWQSSRPSSWMGPGEPSERYASYSSSPPRMQRPSVSLWQRPSPSQPSGNVAPTSTPLNLQTLSSPFYPNGESPHLLSPLTHSQPVPHSPYPVSGPIHGSPLVGRDFNSHELSVSPAPLSNNGNVHQSSTGRDGSIYTQRPHSSPREAPALSLYSQSQTPPFPPSSSLGGPQEGEYVRLTRSYWPRE